MLRSELLILRQCLDFEIPIKIGEKKYKILNIGFSSNGETKIEAIEVS